MRLFERSAYSMMSRFLKGVERPVVLDVGANHGAESQRILEGIPNAVVHAFEPNPACYTGLVRLSEFIPAIVPHRLAVGARSGEVELRITASDRLSSILPVSDTGSLHYQERGREIARERVRAVSLDDWAREQSIDRIDLIKIDVQGLELDVLKGAERLLRESVVAVYSEAQLVESYEGCSTLTDLDAYLRERGFSLYQIHEVHAKGREEQSGYADVLWVRSDRLERVRRAMSRSCPVCEELSNTSLASRRAAASSALSRAFAELADRGLSRVAIFGAGYHTSLLGEALRDPPVEVVCIIDDDPDKHGRRLWGYPVVSQASALRSGIDAAVLSSDSHEEALLRTSQGLANAGVEIVSLYGACTPQPTRAVG